ncbi:uncharacterized protein LOC111816620 isoform X2 [Octodon degus]|uniref:Uncharacterized protein LOC111816620 isoform X2 n=1 Tax=Octodon degus TaxID=10160 RepID=A0A6P6EDK6_OCTDE|nr:uncharacterized protein LOC111816620 isoform X2 [Octodon degus]
MPGECPNVQSPGRYGHQTPAQRVEPALPGERVGGKGKEPFATSRQNLENVGAGFQAVSALCPKGVLWMLSPRPLRNKPVISELLQDAGSTQRRFRGSGVTAPWSGAGGGRGRGGSQSTPPTTPADSRAPPMQPSPEEFAANAELAVCPRELAHANPQSPQMAAARESQDSPQSPLLASPCLSCQLRPLLPLAHHLRGSKKRAVQRLPASPQLSTQFPLLSTLAAMGGTKHKVAPRRPHISHLGQTPGTPVPARLP